MDTNILDEYLRLKAEMETIESRCQEAKSRLIESMVDENKLQYKGFTIVKQVSKTWEYSENVQKIQETLKERKRGEREMGMAKVTKETPFIRVIKRKT